MRYDGLLLATALPRAGLVVERQQRVVPGDADLTGRLTRVLVRAVGDAAAAAALDTDVLGAGQGLGLAPSVVSGSVPSGSVVVGLGAGGRALRLRAGRASPPLVPSVTASSSSSSPLHAATIKDAAANAERNLMLLRRLTSSTSCVLLVTLSGGRLPTARSRQPDVEASDRAAGRSPESSPDTLGAANPTAAPAKSRKTVTRSQARRSERSSTTYRDVSGTARCGRTRRGRGWPRRRGRRRCPAGPSARRCWTP